ncbi:hypothetical protein NC651_039372 [Populus alba x Populus x berolinensis]|nr:hypothetical protein NC651_039372 [Populus alba x Populus x berolinensis]
MNKINESNRHALDSAYLQLKLSVQKKAKNRAKVEKDTERKKEADRELTQTTATTKVKLVI